MDEGENERVKEMIEQNERLSNKVRPNHTGNRGSVIKSLIPLEGKGVVLKKETKEIFKSNEREGERRQGQLTGYHGEPNEMHE